MDWIVNLIDNQIERYLRRHIWGGWATITDYNPAAHTAMVRLEPDGETVGPLPVGSPHPGYADSIPRGTQCYVAKERGKAEVVLCVTHNDQSQVPTAALSLTGDLHVGGALYVYGPVLQLGVVAQLPTPTMDMRGRLAVVTSAVDGHTGTADSLYICLQSATGTLAWKQIVSG